MKVISITKKPQEEFIYEASDAIFTIANDLIINHGVSHLAVVGLLEECKLQYLQADEEDEEA